MKVQFMATYLHGDMLTNMGTQSVFHHGLRSNQVSQDACVQSEHAGFDGIPLVRFSPCRNRALGCCAVCTERGFELSTKQLPSPEGDAIRFDVNPLFTLTVLQEGHGPGRVHVLGDLDDHIRGRPGFVMAVL
jgi:hypothetical protein